MKPNLIFFFCLIILIYFKYRISFIIIKSKYKLCLSREGGTQDERNKKKLAFEEGTKLQRELQRTEKDIEFVVQDTLNPLFLR